MPAWYWEAFQTMEMGLTIFTMFFFKEQFSVIIIIRIFVVEKTQIYYLIVLQIRRPCIAWSNLMSMQTFMGQKSRCIQSYIIFLRLWGKICFQTHVNCWLHSVLCISVGLHSLFIKAASVPCSICHLAKVVGIWSLWLCLTFPATIFFPAFSVEKIIGF